MCILYDENKNKMLLGCTHRKRRRGTEREGRIHAKVGRCPMSREMISAYRSPERRRKTSLKSFLCLLFFSSCRDRMSIELAYFHLLILLHICAGTTLANRREGAINAADSVPHTRNSENKLPENINEEITRKDDSR